MRFMRGALRRRALPVVASLGMVVVPALAAADAANAQTGTNSWVKSANGVAGVEQVLTVWVPQSAGDEITLTYSEPSGSTTSELVTVDAQGYGISRWTPLAAGEWTITATRGTSTPVTLTPIPGEWTVIDTGVEVVGQQSVSVAAMPTVTELLVPGAVLWSTSTSITATVSALAGSSAPTGDIELVNADGVTVQKSPVVASSTSAQGSATFAVVPQYDGPLPLSAIFKPSSPAWLSSQSRPSSPALVGQLPTVSLVFPQTLYLGVPVTISATIAPNERSPRGGGVAFTANQNGTISYLNGGSVSLVDGAATANWRPTRTSLHVLSASYSSTEGGNSGVGSQVVSVLPAPNPDAISTTVTFADPSAKVASSAIQPGTELIFDVVTASGNPVSLIADGPCVLSGSELLATTTGTCTVTVSAMGDGASIASNNATYVFDISKPSKGAKAS